MEISWESFQKVEKFSKSEPLEGKFLQRNFRKFRYTSQGWPLPKIKENSGPFISENFQRFKPDYFIE